MLFYPVPACRDNPAETMREVRRPAGRSVGQTGERPELLDIPTSWAEALEAARRPARLLLVGDVDTGKSTLAALLAREAVRAGRRTAVVDGDLGQSSIGPPTTAGLAFVEKPVESLDELPAAALHFVGLTSPINHLLQTVVALGDLVGRAERAGAETILLDTTGMVTGSAGRALKAAKVNLFRPDALIALEHQREIEHILAPYAHRQTPKVIRLKPSAEARPRTSEQRKARRERQFAEYLRPARDIELPLKEVGLEGTGWRTGERLPGHLRSDLETRLETEVWWAERTAEGVFAIVTDAPRAAAIRIARDSYGDVRVARRESLDGLVVGLLDAEGLTLAIGILLAVDLKVHRLRVRAPLADGAAVRAVRLGSMRLRPNGEEIGWNDPGAVG